jgi:PAS domain-containing protein
VSALILLAQTLTNLSIVPVGLGLPPGWRLTPLQGVAAPVYRVTASRALRVTATNQGATATYRLRNALRPPAAQQRSSERGLTWRWRAETRLHSADLKRRATDDSPIRVLVTFQDGRVIAYSWGNRESRGESFASWAGRNRMVVILERAEDADGSWHVERRNPFNDYRRFWNNAPKPIVSVGIQSDTDGLKIRAAAEIGDITWEGP